MVENSFYLKKRQKSLPKCQFEKIVPVSKRLILHQSIYLKTKTVINRLKTGFYHVQLYFKFKKTSTVKIFKGRIICTTISRGYFGDTSPSRFYGA